MERLLLNSSAFGVLASDVFQFAFDILALHASRLLEQIGRQS